MKRVTPPSLYAVIRIAPIKIALYAAIPAVALLFFLTGLASLRAQPAGEEAEAAPSGQPATAAGGPPSLQLQDEFLYLEVLDDFEEAEDWAAHSTASIGETKALKMVQIGDIRAVDDLNSRPPEGEAYSINQNPEDPNHILGIKTYFYDRGFDRVEVGPPHEYSIRGKARQFSVWVLGRNFGHTLFIKLKDYRGKIHKLKLGKLNYFGWRKLTTIVPGWLHQSSRYSVIDRSLRFVSLFVVSHQHEAGGPFYFYIDGLKALIDRTELNYPGSEIKDNW